MTGPMDPLSRSLHGVLVGLSVSAPDDGELEPRGLSDIHLEFAFGDMVRHLLAGKASIAYGGDFGAGVPVSTRRRAHGPAGETPRFAYTERLMALLRKYSEADRPGEERIRQYFAWPRWQRATRDERNDLKDVATPVPVDAPVADPPDPVSFDPRGSLAERVLNARCLTAMRRRMTDDIHARIVLGGRTTGFSGAYPGILEEAYWAVSAGKPTFILGGFGGCAVHVARLVDTGVAPALSYAHQVGQTYGYRELAGALSEVDWPNVTGTLAAVGPGGLHNGLSEDDNRRLFVTTDMAEIVALVRRGLIAVNGEG